MPSNPVAHSCGYGSTSAQAQIALAMSSVFCHSSPTPDNSLPLRSTSEEAQQYATPNETDRDSPQSGTSETSKWRVGVPSKSFGTVPRFGYWALPFTVLSEHPSAVTGDLSSSLPPSPLSSRAAA